MNGFRGFADRRQPLGNGFSQRGGAAEPQAGACGIDLGCQFFSVQTALIGRDMQMQPQAGHTGRGCLEPGQPYGFAAVADTIDKIDIGAVIGFVIWCMAVV